MTSLKLTMPFSFQCIPLSRNFNLVGHTWKKKSLYHIGHVKSRIIFCLLYFNYSPGTQKTHFLRISLSFCFENWFSLFHFTPCQNNLNPMIEAAVSKGETKWAEKPTCTVWAAQQKRTVMGFSAAAGSRERDRSLHLGGIRIQRGSSAGYSP